VNGCDGTSQPDNGTTVLTITAPAAGQRQEVQDERDSHGQGQVTTTVYSFSGISVRLVRLVVDDYYPGGRLSFDFAGSPPPAVLSQHPLAGQTWSYRLRSTDGSATLSGTDTVQTTGTRQQLSGRSSQSIQVDVVDVRATLTTSFAGTPVQFRIDSLMSLRITDLLPVRMRTTSDGSVGTCRIHTTEDDLLQAA
jgi:hypothetical protein